MSWRRHMQRFRPLPANLLNDCCKEGVNKGSVSRHRSRHKPNTLVRRLLQRGHYQSFLMDKLVVSARLSPMDVDRIYVGQDAEVRFSVFKDANTIAGTLVSISADSLEDSKSGVSYFEAKIELKREDMQLLGQYQLMPGMPAEVLVKTGTRTMLSYMLSPLVRAFSTALIEE